MSQANPSWLMTKFWIATALGAPVYYFEELRAYFIQAMRRAKVAIQRVDVD